MQEMKKGLEERPKDSKMTPLQRKVEEKEIEKCNRNIRYICFERDLRIMYLKAVFNCLNEFLIECKSSSTFINARSSIGPGELKLALKEYNQRFSPAQSLMVLQQAQRRIAGLLRSKCMIPSFRNYKDL